MLEIEKRAIQFIGQNNKFIKQNFSSTKDEKNINTVTKYFLSNSFLYMILNRWHRKKTKFGTTRFLEDAIKNINYFFITWDKILEEDDLYSLESKDFEQIIKIEDAIKNFYNLGLAIDQLIHLIENNKNYWQVISFKKRNVTLAFALTNTKKIYTRSDPSHENSNFYQTFISVIKEEILEVVELEWKKHSTINFNKRNAIELHNLIEFTQFTERIMFNFLENEIADTLRNRIVEFKKYLLKLEKVKKK